MVAGAFGASQVTPPYTRPAMAATPPSTMRARLPERRADLGVAGLGVSVRSGAGSAESATASGRVRGTKNSSGGLATLAAERRGV